ncbi:thioredoxin family protein [Guptibacillus algicola]|uniref:thioredoxin family protein n=1 Tax=Guptibacillus algicola TaxID=225844 RepID=UPI001CD63EEB|nr:thioredoxin family protein [Alkalihalobacillus algicola]MCA0986694.1 thioredoxin family protein [Alkalihalobacillus algicola]
MIELNKEVEIERAHQESMSVLFFYTPFCSTCKIAERMLGIASEANDLKEHTYKVNLNYFPKLAEKLTIQSVPALTIFKNGQEVETIFAIESVVRLNSLLHKYKED